MAAPPLPGIEHIVVLMLENRSFDNVLGGLYPEKTKHGLYRGVPKGWTNPLDPRNPDLGSVTAFQGPQTLSTWIMPYPDPGELYSDMVQQIFGSYSSTGPANMQGFAWNYSVQACSISGQDWPAVAPVPGNIMQYYSEGTMPVTHALAKHYAVCDSWFAAAPVQTIANRVLAHCGTPGKIPGTNLSRINNYPDYLKNYQPTNPPVHDTTIFELLDQQYPDAAADPCSFEPYSPPRLKLNWKVYYWDAPVSIICKYVQQQMCPPPFVYGGNVFNYLASFNYDVQHDQLPKYSFIEPCYSNHSEYGVTLLTANSNHPGGAIAPQQDTYNGEDLPPPVNVLDGESLLCDIYSTLVAKPEVFNKTLLIVTYDEHGGLFDHIAPPEAVSPFSPPVDNFNYDRYGVRVPAILINPYIRPGTVMSHGLRTASAPSGSYPWDHTSILHTLIEQFNLQTQINLLSPGAQARIESAPLITGIISDKGTAPIACPPIPATPPPPVVPALPPCRAPTAQPRPLQGLAGALVPIYRYLEAMGARRGPKVT